MKPQQAYAALGMLWPRVLGSLGLDVEGRAA